MRIVLARHGPVDMAIAPWAWVTPRQSQSIIAEYTRAGIVVDGLPAATLDTARACEVLVSSTAPRCVHSARALSRDGLFLSEALFDESAGEPALNWRFPKLPLLVWWYVLRLAWRAGCPVCTESFSAARARASTAAQRLIEIARERGSVFLIGHAMMNVLIARHLTAAGWSGRIRPLPGPWEFAVYRMLLGPRDGAPSSAV